MSSEPGGMKKETICSPSKKAGKLPPVLGATRALPMTKITMSVCSRPRNHASLASYEQRLTKLKGEDYVGRLREGRGLGSRNLVFSLQLRSAIRVTCGSNQSRRAKRGWEGGGAGRVLPFGRWWR